MEPLLPVWHCLFPWYIPTTQVILLPTLHISDSGPVLCRFLSFECHPHLPLLPPTSVYIVLTLPSNFSLQLAWLGRPCFTAPHKIIQCSFFPHPGFFSSIHVYPQVTCYTLLCFVCIFQVSASSPKLGTLCHCPIYSALKDVWGSTC